MSSAHLPFDMTWQIALSDGKRLDVDVNTLHKEANTPFSKASIYTRSHLVTVVRYRRTRATPSELSVCAADLLRPRSCRMMASRRSGRKVGS
jgi:hypothetical protein